MNLSEKIAIVRKARRFTQEELGSKIGVSRQTISSWEKGDYEPTLDSVRAISEVLNVSYDTLLDDKVDLTDKQVLNVALKNLDNNVKAKVNNSFRYRIREYTVRKKDYAEVIVYFSFLAIFTIAVIVNGLFIKKLGSINFYIEFFFGTMLFIMLCIIAIPIYQIKKIKAGGNYNSFGTLSQTHLVIIGWSDTKFDRTVYIPVNQIERMELGKNANRKHGTVIVYIKERSKPLVTNDIVEPQKLIDIFNNLETFVESSYGK